ncbi:hypothetical protein TYRP_023159 [Tyrophagus putrescentiae]|nr:hypothetical protein TYRP_023157 [Tyrophagus putrescentiae]KAH9390332.1 hypothetical protein TYRP_023159 [Tyrophagus putrescentiae]
MQHTATSSAASSEHILFAHALSRQAEFHVTGLLDGIVLILAIADDEVVQFYDYHSPTSYSKEVIYSVLKSMTHEKPIRAWSIGRGLKRSSFEHLFGFGEMGSLAQLNSAQTASYFVPFGLAAVAAA